MLICPTCRRECSMTINQRCAVCDPDGPGEYGLNGLMDTQDARIAALETALAKAEAMAAAAGRVIATGRMMCDGLGLANEIDMIRSLKLYDQAAAAPSVPTPEIQP